MSDFAYLCHSQTEVDEIIAYFREKYPKSKWGTNFDYSFTGRKYLHFYIDGRNEDEYCVNFLSKSLGNKVYQDKSNLYKRIDYASGPHYSCKIKNIKELQELVLLYNKLSGESLTLSYNSIFVFFVKSGKQPYNTISTYSDYIDYFPELSFEEMKIYMSTVLGNQDNQVRVKLNKESDVDLVKILLKKSGVDTSNVRVCKSNEYLHMFKDKSVVTCPESHVKFNGSPKFTDLTVLEFVDYLVNGTMPVIKLNLGGTDILVSPGLSVKINDIVLNKSEMDILMKALDKCTSHC